MIAADTSVWVDFFKGNKTEASRLLEKSLGDGNIVMPHHVIFEILSGTGTTAQISELIQRLPKLEILEGFWERAAELRKTLLKKGLKARSMDCLIAQSCMDQQVPLIAADQDYRHFAKRGLKIL